MSRCFPYPPPSYSPSLTESIGRGKETEKKKKKKKKKKHKREKEKKIRNGQRKDDVMSTKEERSCITEEHRDSSNYESDGSSPQITGKRKRHGLCSPIKPDQKRLKSDQIPASRDNHVEFRSTSIGRADNDRNSDCHISRQYEEMRKATQQYTDLVENWNPPAFSMFLDVDCDEDWLLGSKKRVNPNPQKKASSSCCSSTLWPPRARFLPDANTYALPYVFPF